MSKIYGTTHFKIQSILEQVLRTLYVVYPWMYMYAKGLYYHIPFIYLFDNDRIARFQVQKRWNRFWRKGASAMNKHYKYALIIFLKTQNYFRFFLLSEGRTI